MARLSNRDIAALFIEMSDLLAIRGGDPHRSRAFYRAARIVENLGQPVEQALAWGVLEKRRGVGEGTVHRLKQMLRTGTCDDLERLRAGLPGIRELLEVRGLGPSTIRRLVQRFRVRNLDDLEMFARSGMLLRLPRMGPEQVHKILSEIDVVRRRGRSRWPLAEAQQAAEEVAEAMRAVAGAGQVMVAGSARRQKAMVGDLDILVGAENATPFIETFTHMDGLESVVQVRNDGASVRLASLQQVDLRVVSFESWGAALHTLTGSKLHNIVLRARANRLRLKISERGVMHRLSGEWLTTGATEDEIFRAVGLAFIPPELRENLGEIDAAADGKLPELINAADLRGDLRVHLAHAGAVEPYAQAARRLGLEYLAVLDDEAGVFDPQRANRMRRAAAKHGVELLCGRKVRVLPDGSLSEDRDVLRRYEWVVGELPGDEKAMGWEATTVRLERAFEHGLIDVLAEPTGRVLGVSKGRPVDLDRVLKAARRGGVALEIGGDPTRMDLDEIGCRQAKDAGNPLTIASTAARPEDLEWSRYALASARRGWLTAGDVLNHQPLNEIQAFRRERLRRWGIAVPRTPVSSPRRGDVEKHHVELHRIVEDRGATPVGSESESRELAERLRRPLDTELIQRLESFLADGADPALEAALALLGDNPLQEAFNLLLQGRA